MKNFSNEKKLLILHGIGFLVVCGFGAIVHDTARLVAGSVLMIFFPANLCLWEQGKILLFGMTAWFILEYIIVGRKMKGFIFIHSLVATMLPIVMLIIYMSHSKIFGGLSLEGAHIILSVALILAGFLTSTMLTISKRDFSRYTPHAVIAFAVICLLFAVFTYLPPELGIFYDAINSTFGPAF